MVSNTMPEDTSDICTRVKEEKRKFEAKYGAWRKEAKENYDMVAGDGRQWDEEAREKLRNENRPCVEFNRLGVIVDAVSGSEINNRKETSYIPRLPGNVQSQGLGEVRTAAAKWVRDNCDAEDEETDAFVDVLITGVGCTQTVMDYEGDEEGQILILRKDPMRLGWDAASTQRNFNDRKCQWEECKFTKEEVQARWPEKAEEIVSAQEVDDDEEDELKTATTSENAYKDEANPGITKGMVDVTHFQWYEVDTIYKVAGAQGVVEMPEDRYKVMQMLDPMLKGVKMPRRRYMEAFIAGNVELEVAPLCPQATKPAQDFTFQFVTGKRDRNKGYWYGLVRPGKDPQRWANKFFSQILHIINTNAKGGLLAETNAFQNPKKAEEDWAKADSIVMLQPGGLAKIQPKVPAQVPPGLWQAMDTAISSIRDAMGVNMELLGMVDRAQAGVLEGQRTQAALTILAPFFSNLRLYRKRQGRLLAYFIKEYISDGRLIRVVGQEGAQFMPLIRDPIDVDYEVVVDESPTARDTKEKTWMALMPIVQAMQQQGIMPPPEIFDYLPVPTSLAQKLKQAAIQHMQKQSQDQSGKRMQEAEIWKTEATAEKEESAAAKNYADATATGLSLLQMAFGQGPVPGATGQPMPGQPMQQGPQPGGPPLQ